MLTLRDARSGELTQALPAGRRLLRVCVQAPLPEQAGAAMRGYLTADLIRRLAERAGLIPWVIDLLPDGTDVGGMAALRTRCDALNIYPTRDTVVGAAALDGVVFPGGADVHPMFDIGVAAPPAGSAASPALPGELVQRARLWACPGPDGWDGDAGGEPLVIRLAAMRRRYSEPMPAGGTAPDAAQALARWRGLVAGWARSPSGAMSRPHAEAITSACADDLDTATALSALDALADDPGVPDGVKFETFAAADRLLGLDLTRDVGRP